MEQANRNYVDKAVFLKDIMEYRKAFLGFKENGGKRPKIPESMGKAFIDIAHGIGSRWNFRSYTYLDEMIGDAILDCVKAAGSFDPEKSDNPFGYFSRVVWRSFITRLTKEKALHAVKITCAFDPSTGTYSVIEGDTTNYGDAKDELLEFFYSGKVVE